MTRGKFRGVSAMALVAGAGLLGAVVEPAQAIITTQPFSVDTTGTAVEPLSFSQFDTSLGTLTGVRFTLSNSITTEISTFSISGGEGTGNATMSVGFEIKGPGQGGPLSLLLFSGTGSATSSCPFGPCSSAGNDTTVPPTFVNPELVSTAADLLPYKGLGTFTADVDLTGPVLGDTCTPTDSFTPTCTPGGSASWSGDLTVNFLFNPAPPSEVPEPSSLGLFVAGLAAVAGIRRRRYTRR